MALKFREFKYADKGFESAVNDFFAKEKGMTTQGTSFLEDRLCFIWDNSNDEELDKKRAIKTYKDLLAGVKTDLLIRREEAFFAERDAKSGRGKPGDVMEKKNDVAKCEARISYIEEKLKELDIK